MSENIISVELCIILVIGVLIFIIGVKDGEIRLWIRIVSIIMVLPALLVWLCIIIAGGSPYLLLIWCAISIYYVIINTTY